MTVGTGSRQAWKQLWRSKSESLKAGSDAGVGKSALPGKLRRGAASPKTLEVLVREDYGVPGLWLA